MIFLNPHETTDEDLQKQLRELTLTTIFSYDFLKQEVRRCYLENKVMVVVDESHIIDWSYERFQNETPAEIEAFILKWAGEKP